MTKYLLSTEKFGLSEDSFHLLRNRFETAKFPYSEIEECRLEMGHAIKNVPVVLVLGALLSLGSLYWILSVLNFFRYGAGTIYIEAIVAPVIPLMLGIYMIYVALKKDKVLAVTAHSRTHNFSIESIVEDKQLPLLVETLRNHSVEVTNKLP